MDTTTEDDGRGVVGPLGAHLTGFAADVAERVTIHDLLIGASGLDLRAGMSGSGFVTRPQWLTDRHLAHPYMKVADGTPGGRCAAPRPGQPFSVRAG